MTGKSAGRADDSPFPFSWPEFSDWYAALDMQQLEPARATFERMLNLKLDRELSEFDRYRITVSTSRVKSPARTWAKMTNDKYRSKIDSLDSIPDVIDDLVGLRVICNNLCDIGTLKEILADLPSAEDEPYSLSVEPGSTKNYFDDPKASGYRALHVNLATRMPGLDGPVRLRGELQARTLLQDGWGELTHEDTYKPGVALPQLVTTLALRMANFLTVVDELAQDLRDELDRLARQAASSSEGTVPEPETVSGDHEPLQEEASERSEVSAASRDAVLAEIRSLVGGLTRPAPLTDLAQQIQSKFGTEIVHRWLGYGSLRGLLTVAVPNVVIKGPPPGVVVPAGLGPVGASRSGSESSSEIPRLIRSLRERDRHTPAVGRRKLDQLLRQVRDVLTVEAWSALELPTEEAGDMRAVNKLSRHARELAARKGELVSRSYIDYVLKALLWSGALRPGLELSDLRVVLVDHFIKRAEALQISVDRDKEMHNIQEWLTPGD